MRPKQLRSRSASIAAWVALVVWPAWALAHERWVPHALRRPIDADYFTHMRGEVVRLSLTATATLAGVIMLWYLAAIPLAERLATTERARGSWAALRNAIAFLLDAETERPWIDRGQRIAARVFERLPALVLGLGVYQQWFIMPSFPLEGPLATTLRVIEAALAVWVLVGIAMRALGIVLCAAFVYLALAYGLAAIDAIPVLASAFYYVYRDPRAPTEINASQLAGLRLSLGIGFALLGLVNKIYVAALFIGVGDQHPQLLAGPRQLFPSLTRESWSFGTALGEMVFGLLLLIGIFDKLTTIALTLIFAHFISLFGFAEVVHLYPIAGFAVLFFRAPPGTVLDGAVFRTHVALWKLAGRRSSAAIHATAVVIVALGASFVLLFVPLFAVVQILPRW